MEILSIFISSFLEAASISPNHMRPAKLRIPPAAMLNHGSLYIGVDFVPAAVYMEEEEDGKDNADDSNSDALYRTRSSV